MKVKLSYKAPQAYLEGLSADSMFCDAFSAYIDDYEYDEIQWEP